MNVTSAPSPNFDERALPVNMLVLHYTGMETGDLALARMRDPDARVSAHYMVRENGDVVQLVDEAQRAWHAGVSFWDGETDLNSASVGIEIVNGGHDFGLPEFPGKQISSVIDLSAEIIDRHKIAAFNVVGHSDIAPARKCDPGEKFPWAELAGHGIGVFPGQLTDDQRPMFEFGSRDRGIAIVQKGLAFIGYKTEVTGRFDQLTLDTVIAVQRRYRSSNCDGVIDVQTLEVVTKLADLKKRRKRDRAG